MTNNKENPIKIDPIVQELQNIEKIIENYEEKIKLRHSDLDLQARSFSPKVTTSPINVEHMYQV